MTDKRAVHWDRRHGRDNRRLVRLTDAHGNEGREPGDDGDHPCAKEDIVVQERICSREGRLGELPRGNPMGPGTLSQGKGRTKAEGSASSGSHD